MRIAYGGYGSMYSCQPGKFPLLPLFRRFIETGELTGQVYRGEWNDIGTPQRLEQLRASAA